MIRNLLTVAARSFLRHRFYSIINVLGLSSGLVCALFIFLWVRDETGTDRFHKDADRIFHIVCNMVQGDGSIITWWETPGPLADDIRDNIADVELAIRVMNNGSQLLQYEDRNFLERSLYADSGFFRLFSFPILAGTPDAIMNDKSSVAISEKVARNLFGDADPIGKVIRVSMKYDLEVKAVFADITPATTLRFDVILPFEIYRQERGDEFDWGNYDHALFVKLYDAGKASSVIAQVNRGSDERVKSGEKDEVEFYIQPLADRHLYAQFENGVPVGGRIKYVQLFSVVAVFIVVIACINFMNLATAKASSRSKEVGVRKVVGAQRMGLISQFILESVALSFISMLIAVGVVYVGLPLFNSLVSKKIMFSPLDLDFFLPAAGLVLLTGIFAGSYPAFFLSSYRPVDVLKGNTAPAFSGVPLRKALVVFQFSLTVILTASALVLYDQVQFIRNKNLGYVRESVINFSARGGLRTNFEAFKTDLLQVPGVQFVSRSSSSLVQVNNQNSSVNWTGEPADNEIYFRSISVDYDFLETMGLRLKEGRFFSKEFADTGNCVVTQRAVDVMGIQSPIGHDIEQWGNKGKIVGVVEDFHSRSMHEAMDPVVFLFMPRWTGRVFVRFDAAATSDVVADVGRLAKKYAPEYPFDYTFLDEDFEKMYNNERVTGSLAYGFTAMAVIISGLGLLGLAAYTAERRKKEISIRKTMGATVTGIVSLMSVEFMRLTLIAAAIGTPVAYWLMARFLESYAYHAPLRWDIFVFTAAFVLLVSLSIVVLQVTRASLVNPVDSLRNE